MNTMIIIKCGFDHLKKLRKNYLKNTKADWLLSFDGKAGSKDNTVQIPKIYKEHVYLNNGNSSFRRVIGNSKNTTVHESLYMNLKE